MIFIFLSRKRQCSISNGESRSVFLADEFLKRARLDFISPSGDTACIAAKTHLNLPGPFGYTGVRLSSQSADAPREHVTVPKIPVVVCAVAGRGTGTDKIAGKQLHVARDVLDELRDVENHVRGTFVLFYLSVELQSDLKILGIRNQGRRDQVRPDR